MISGSKLLLCVLAVLAFAAGPSLASDSAALQFTVPAPDPAPAGDVISFQALAVNTGSTQWEPGSYYWVAEIYDLDHKFVARTDQISPRDIVPTGAVASISIQFQIPDTMFGRRLYRVFLVKDSKTLIESEEKGFQITEKPIPPAPPPPQTVTYHMEGNITTSFKDSSRSAWKNASGATTFNTVGKIKENSYLINLYVLHQQGNVFNPSIIVANFYAPWGVIYGGDISPNLGPLAVSGQGMRGVMLEQKKGMLDWDILGGQTITSQAGTQTANGRYARSLYSGKFGFAPAPALKFDANYFISSDETGSLSADPNSPNFRGPSLVAQKNSGYGLDAVWEPVKKLKFTTAYQKDQYWADVSGASVADDAVRAEVSWERKMFKADAYIQRAGPNYFAFGNSAVVGDRLTYDGRMTFVPSNMYSLSLSGDQYRDNLENDPDKTTTTQRLLSMTHALQLPTATTFSLNGSLNTAKGQPSTTVDNQTLTTGFSASQIIKKHSVTFNFQDSTFKDNTHIAHDLDTLTAGISASFKLPKNWGATFGVTESDTKDKTDDSKRTSTSIGPSLSLPLSAVWTAQFWGTYTATKNTSPTLPADTKLLAFNSEYTLLVTKQFSTTYGVGANISKDAIVPTNTYNELTVSFRCSYTF